MIRSRWLIGLLLVGCSTEPSVPTPEVADGFIDLSKWNFRDDGPVELDGPWYFVWDDFVDAMPWTEMETRLPHRLQVPAEWDATPNPTNPSETLPRHGAATYALRLRLAATERVSIRLPWIATAADLVALRADGLSLAHYRKGQVSMTAGDEVPIRSVVPTLMIVPPLDQPPDRPFDITLHIKVSNHHYPFGGMRGAPVIDSVASVEKETLTDQLRSSAILGILFIVGVYHLMLYRARREDLAALHFGGLCLSFGLRELSMSGFLPRLGWGLSIDGYIWTVRAEFVAVPIMVTFVGLFIHAMLPHRIFYRFVVWWGAFLGASLSLMILLTLPDFFASWRILNQVHIIVSILACFVHLGIQMYRRTELAPSVAFGFAVIAAGAVNDILFSKDIIMTGFIAPYTIIAFVMIQSWVLARRNAQAHQKAERLGEHLQEEVNNQTIELREQTEAAMNSKDAALKAQIEAERLRQQAFEDAEKLRELDHQKTTFFQNMSHELRTPLTLILGPLEAEARRPSANENIDIALKNATRLLRLVNQLLDFQKLSAGRTRLTLEPLNLNQFLLVVGDYFRSACSTKEIDFRLTHDGEALNSTRLVSVMGEVDALEKVIFNYLSNALKYTPKGGCIELGLLTVDEGVKIFVRDSGPGISPDDQEKLFQVFSQVESGTTREYEGTGLGLALVKSLVEEMHGRVGVTSSIGDGATFYATLPLSDLEAFHESEVTGEFSLKPWLMADTGETGLEVAPPGSEDDSNAPLIVVIDDLEDMRHLIGSTLTERGYRVAKAANGEQGYRLIVERKPDLVITDWMMPKLSGPDLLKRLRSDQELAGVPVVLLTAKSDEESKLIGTEIGADVFLGKPFNAQELTSTVRNLLGLKAREKEVEELNKYITESVLKRYLPPTLIGEILSGAVSMDKPAELRSLTILFSDLKEFTNISETLGPEAISQLLNEYLSVMNEVIFEHQGTIDKFIGDAIMVLFGAPKDMPPSEQVARASACALAMQDAMHRLCQTWISRGALGLQMRIGIHHGRAVVGNFGSQQRSDYTAIGPSVNLASRIETACEPGEVYVSDEVCALVPEGTTTQEVGSFSLKGIDGDTRLHRLVSPG